jgi:hypothetical protein
MLKRNGKVWFSAENHIFFCSKSHIIADIIKNVKNEIIRGESPFLIGGVFLCITVM